MKKANYLLPVIGSLFLTGCTWLFYERIQEFDDEFKNTKKVIARVDIRPEERRTEVNYAKVIFERNLTDKQENVKAYFVISRASTSFKVENLGYLKASAQTFELPVERTTTELKSRTETSFSTYSQSDSTGVRTGVNSDTDERIWIDDKFMINLTPEMILKIKEADKFIMRFYFGPVQATFKFKGSDLNRIHTILDK